MKKVIFDTNILLRRDVSSFLLETMDVEEEIIIPLEVIEELDKFKVGDESKNQNARSFHRFMNKLRKEGKLNEGVSFHSKIIKVPITKEMLNPDKVDHRIIQMAIETGSELVSEDMSLLIIADALSVESRTIEEVSEESIQSHTGIHKMNIDSVYLDMIAKYQEIPLSKHTEVKYNDFVIMTDEDGNKYYGFCRRKNNMKVVVVEEHKSHIRFGIRTIAEPSHDYIEQEVLAKQIESDDVHFLSVFGPSGSGKTLTSVATALSLVVQKEQYSKISFARPTVSIGQTLGLLPGDLKEKHDPWLGALKDSLSELDIANYGMSKSSFGGGEITVDMLEADGRLEIISIEHLRGRTLNDQILIVDDAQNLTSHEATTIITRAGRNTKVIFLGDISDKQIDNARLSRLNNGLAYVMHRLGDSDIVGHITLERVQRSPLAKLGVEKL